MNNKRSVDEQLPWRYQSLEESLKKHDLCKAGGIAEINNYEDVALGECTAVCQSKAASLA